MLPIPETQNPKPVTLSGREAIKRDFYDMDSLLGELAVPKEQINRPQPGSAPGSAGHPELVSGPAQYTDAPEPVEPMPAEVAALSGKTIANTIDTAVGTGLSLYAKNTNPEKYQATEKQIHNLETAWAAVAAKYNYRIEDSPWFNVLILSGAVYIPHFQEAKNDRRFAQMDEKFEEMKAEMKKQAAALELMKAAQSPAA